MTLAFRGNTDWTDPTYPPYAVAGDLVLGIAEPDIVSVPDFTFVGRKFIGTYGVSLFSRIDDGTEAASYADIKAWWAFEDAKITSFSGEGERLKPFDIESDHALADTVFLWIVEAQNTLTWFAPPTQPPYYVNPIGAVDGTNPRASQMQVVSAEGAVGGEELDIGGGGGNDRYGQISLVLSQLSTPPPPVPPVDPNFTRWPGRHLRIIDVARKLKAHALDNTRHSDPATPFVTYTSRAAPFVMNPGPQWELIPFDFEIEEALAWTASGEGHHLVPDHDSEFHSYGSATLSVAGSSNNREYQLRPVVNGLAAGEVVTFSVLGNGRSETIGLTHKGVVSPGTLVNLGLEIRQTDGDHDIAITSYEGWNHSRWE